MDASRPITPTIDIFRAASVNVVMGTAVFTGLGGLAGSSIGVLKSQPAIPLAFATSLNTGIFSFSFFSCREYLIHPLFNYLQFYPLESSPHTRNIVSTSIAGLTTGTVVSYFARGSRNALRSGLTLGLGCVVIQSMFNEAQLVRIKTLAWSEERRAILEEMDSAQVAEQVPSEPIPTFTRHISSPVPSVPSRETFSERSDRLIGSGIAWLRDSLARVSPVKKMDDATYQEKLAQRLHAIEKERRDVSVELEKLESLREK
ncbi:hypothetical protein T439DRAFT_324550 [Meredithblackwellia eburnea MCA 4105]